jgi:LysR family transcriptional regulator (chromosome initiation inhibitor)
MVPEPQLDGRVVPLGTRLHVDVPLHWQRWRLDSPVLDRLTDAVRRAARSALRA